MARKIGREASDMAEDHITIEEAAAVLRRSVPTVWRLIRRYGVGTFRRPLDRRAYVRRGDIDRVLESFEPRREGERNVS